MKEEFCCNCHWYDGVHGCQGCAECKIKYEIVLWSDCCDHLWLIPERLKIGLKTNADRIRAMTSEELAKWFVDIQLYTYKCTLQGKEPKEYPYTETGWREWLKQECE